MILQKSDLARIFAENPTRKLWIDSALESTRLQMHVLGIGLQNYIQRIDQHESEKTFQLRKKYGKTNRDIFARMLRPIDNIWQGRGGGVFYNTSEGNDKKLRVMLSNVDKGYQIRDWVRLFWKPRYIDDPQGIIFIETDPTNINGVYPTYKASRTIFDALPNGRGLEYIIFKTDQPNIFRVIDDVLDRLVKFEGDKVTELKSKEYPVFPNYFNRVPAIILSDIPKDGRDDLFMSPIQDEVELADGILREGTIASIHRFKHGFPKPWKYPEVCGTCKGTGLINASTCPDCNGSKIKLISDPADISVFAWPDKENPEISEKGGYISPALEYLKYADESLILLEEKMSVTHWGSFLQRDKSVNETATGRFIDTQPVNNRLVLYAKAAESIETFITNSVATFNFQSGWKGATVNLGRRFQIEGPDTIWKKYEDARKNGAPQATLDDMLQDYYETKFQGNELELQKYLKLAQLEPGVHYTPSEAKAGLPWFEYMKKTYFPEYVSTLSPMAIIGTDLQALRKGLVDFTTKKIEETPDGPEAPDLEDTEDLEDTPPAPGQKKKKEEPVED